MLASFVKVKVDFEIIKMKKQKYTNVRKIRIYRFENLELYMYIVHNRFLTT